MRGALDSVGPGRIGGWILADDENSDAPIFAEVYLSGRLEGKVEVSEVRADSGRHCGFSFQFPAIRSPAHLLSCVSVVAKSAAEKEPFVVPWWQELRTKMLGASVDNALIFDIGLCSGSDTEFYLKKGFRTVALEANPALVEVAKRRFSQAISTGQLTIISKAIAEYSGKTTFYISGQSAGWSSIHRSMATRMNSSYEEVEVETVTLQDIIKTYGTPYYMKIDIEGADNIPLEALAKLCVKPRYVSSECHVPDIIQLLHTADYRSFKLVNQEMHAFWRPPEPALEGEFVPVTHWQDSSGLFGRELGEAGWVGREQAIELFEGARRLSAHPTLYRGWIDVHARLLEPSA